MTEVAISEEKLKSLLKTAIVEVIEERKEWLHDLIEEALEDIALGNAIEQGRNTEDVSKEEVLISLNSTK